MRAWDQRLRPGVADALAAYRERGYVVVGVTNQGGVAMGFLTEADVQAINRRLTEELAPGLFDLVLYCPYHPRGRVAAYRRDAECRKPRPGMAFEARDLLGLDLGASLMVGDRDVDQGFAREAGIPSFHWAHDFFRAPDREARARRGEAPRPSGAPRPASRVRLQVGLHGLPAQVHHVVLPGDPGGEAVPVVGAPRLPRVAGVLAGQEAVRLGEVHHQAVLGPAVGAPGRREAGVAQGVGAAVHGGRAEVEEGGRWWRR